MPVICCADITISTTNPWENNAQITHFSISIGPDGYQVSKNPRTGKNMAHSFWVTPLNWGPFAENREAHFSIVTANVNDSFNAVFVEGATVGDLMFYGRGAGGGPTASAVLGDLVDAAVNVANGAAARLSITEKARLRSVDELSSQYYLTMVVSDEPGVLAQVATVFGIHGVSIQVMEQSGTGGDAELCLILHETTEAALHATLDELNGLDVVRGIGSVIRLVSDD